MGLYASWLQSFGPDQEMGTIKESNGVKFLYSKQKNKFTDGYVGRTLYHVWNGDHWICAMSDFQAADRHYQEEIKKCDWSQGEAAY